uniref:C2H2-type domain-containing protein n=1 Tax=Lactuca sativa TaxID=4236 RepID=A0A9R1VVC4_LACSA|nr:hypothetical protein LSAT_V11C400161810 [Lactuca sativa]
MRICYIAKMEEEMITLQNIMPVDLAIKRELEYRKKMEISRNQHQNNLKPLVASQGPPIQSWKEDYKMAASGSHKSRMFQFSSTRQTLREKRVFSCKACQLTFGTVFDLSGHVVSQQHKFNVSEMKKRKQAISNPIWCELCKSSCSSLGEMERHLNGFKIVEIFIQVRGLEGQRMVDRKRKVQPSNARFICVVCDMAFASVFHLKMHGETYAHRSNLCMARNGGENVSNPFLCEVCDILCSSGKVMKLHAAGVKHKGYLQEFEDARRARFYGFTYKFIDFVL